MNEVKTAQKEPGKEIVERNSLDPLADFMYDALDLSVADMLKYGVHFGHKTSRWNPKMKPFIFGSKNGIHIIDLDKSLVMLEKALAAISQVVSNGGKIIFVGTKPQSERVVKWAGELTEMPYVVNRWLGGTFTNFNEIKKRIRYLNSQEEKMKRGEFEKYTKYERGKFQKEIEKMNDKMGGIKKLENPPQMIFAVDIKEDNLAIKEARNMKIPVVAIIDTNNDPTLAEFPIPANDDALSSLKYILGMIVKKIIETKNTPKVVPEKKEANGVNVKNNEK